MSSYLPEILAAQFSNGSFSENLTPGNLVVPSPRRAARGRTGEILFVALDLQARTPMPAAELDRLSALMAQVYFETPGSVTAALRAAFVAAMRLAPKKDSSFHFEIQQPAQPGDPFLVTTKDGDCPEFKQLKDWIFPEKPCISAQFRLAGDPTNDLVFEHFSFDVTNLPGAAKVAEFGDVQVLGFRCEGDFQKASLPGETQPYLLPKQVVTSVETSKGKMVITNQYAPQVPKAGKK